MLSTGRTAFLLGAISTLVVGQKTDANCDDVVIFMARGNDAPFQPDGRTFTFVETTCAKVAPATCDYIDIVFDATKGGPYCDQVAEGAKNGVSQITAFNQKCPNTKIVVNGYSQGAHVAGDVLGGPGGCTGTSTGIDPNSAAGKAIAAALLWGDVRHTANQPYSVLDGANKEKSPRTGQDLANLNRYSSVLRAFCAAGDPVCAGGDVVEQHLNYFELHTEDAANWVIEKLALSSPSSSSAAPSSTPAASSTTGASTTGVATSASTTGVASEASTTGASTDASTTAVATSASVTGESTQPAAPTTLVTSTRPTSTPVPTESAENGNAPAPQPTSEAPIQGCPVVYEYVTA